MILTHEPIDVSIILGALEQFAEFSSLQLPPGASIFETEKGRTLIEDGTIVFADFVLDAPDQENTIRRALSWLLNQTDEVLADMLRRGHMPFPTQDINQRRRYLEMLWNRTFSSWRVDGFDPKSYEVVGIPE